jgi:uncharacterized protein YbjT (DUF2867 family)
MVRGNPDRALPGGSSAQTVVAQFEDPSSLEAALEGVTRAYLVTPSSPDAEAHQVRFAELAAAAGVKLAFQPMIVREGCFVAPIGEARVSAVDVRDIAAIAAMALTEPGHESKTYTITGPAAVTHAEMANAIGQAMGREVTFIDVPPEAFAGALGAAGVPTWQVDGLVEDYAHYARGEAAAISPHVRDVTGVEPRGIGTFARDYAGAFVGA